MSDTIKIDADVRALLRRIAELNPGAGEIGAGMLAQIQHEATRLLSLTGSGNSVTDSAGVAIAAVQLSRITDSTSEVTMTLHWRRGISENEMRGIAIEEALTKKPGFSVAQVLVSSV